MLMKLSWKFDMIIYRLFYWRWTPRLKEDRRLLLCFKEWIDGWIEQESQTASLAEGDASAVHALPRS